MITTTFMGLTRWDAPGDSYNHSQLSNNFDAIDRHDHVQASGRGKQIPTAGIQDHAITQIKLAFNAVTTTEILDGTILFQDISPSVFADEVPLGLVLPWWRKDQTVPVPSKYHLCDGTAWNSFSNDLGIVGGNILDLRNRFILGADPNASGATDPASTPQEGAVGGSNSASLAHSHIVDNHTHGINQEAPDTTFTGTLVTSTVGDHRHYIDWPIAQDNALSQTYYIVKPGDSSIESSNPGGALTNGAFVAYGANGLPLALSAYTLSSGGFNLGAGNTVQTFYGGSSFNGSHNHSIGPHNHQVNYHAHGGATSGATPNTNSALTNTDIRPNFTGLLYIMKVKL